MRFSASLNISKQVKIKSKTLCYCRIIFRCTRVRRNRRCYQHYSRVQKI